jgi:pimeloyl-ACP methyl ester carboxylesterase
MRISGITYVSSRRTRKSFPIFKILFSLVLLSVIIISLLSAFIAWDVINPPRKDVEPFSANIVPDYRDVAFFDMERKLTLKGWYFESGNSRNTVILAHGYGENRLQFDEKTADMIKSFLGNNFNVLTFDFRNSGDSEGDLTSFGYNETNDVLGAISYAKKALGAEKIVLAGFSTGASSCLIACTKSDDIHAVIADSPFMDLGSFIDDRLFLEKIKLRLPKFIFGKTTIMAADLLGHMKSEEIDLNSILSDAVMPPVMLIHASNDELIPEASANKLFAALSKNSINQNELWITEDAGHTGSYMKNPTLYMQKVISFLDKALE